MTAKGATWAGVCHCPQSPHADMHGLVRFCLRTDKGPSHVCDVLGRYGARLHVRDLGYYWGQSQSIAEIEASSLDYGQVLTCEPALAYLSVKHYSRLPKTTWDLRKGKANG